MSEDSTDFDREKYVRRWNDHVGQLTRLKWNLDPDDYDELEKIQRRLEEFVEVCADNAEEVDEYGHMDAEKRSVDEQ